MYVRGQYFKALYMHGKESMVHSNGAAHLVLIYMHKCFPVWQPPPLSFFLFFLSFFFLNFLYRINNFLLLFKISLFHIIFFFFYFISH